MPPEGAWGETAAPGPAPTTTGPQTQAAPSASKFNPEQLDAMLAPIALYPDDLLVQTLMAATYPLQIVEATRWLERDKNKDLKGDALAKALEPLPWDPSVKSLVPFPQVLEQLNQHLDWTQQIGYAMATQQEDVLDSVQRLRSQAQETGHLKTTEQQVVSAQAVVDDQGQPTPNQTITIQPADPQVVYVPAYNPSVVYGSWPYPASPPVYYPPPSLLSWRRTGDRDGLCGRCRGRRLPLGLGGRELGLWRLLRRRQHQRQPDAVQQHHREQRQPW